jgi:DNA-binding NtrC family response regulator
MAELILVIESDPVIRGEYRSTIGDLGCRMLACDHPEIALHLVESARPDLVIVDMHPAGTSGTDLVRDIKARYPDLPVLICAECRCYEEDFGSWAADACISRSAGLDLLERELRRRLALAEPVQEAPRRAQ